MDDIQVTSRCFQWVLLIKLWGQAGDVKLGDISKKMGLKLREWMSSTTEIILRKRGKSITTNLRNSHAHKGTKENIPRKETNEIQPDIWKPREQTLSRKE